ncbi:hypothetical protein F511_17503 [Dorcoceras hygrometricum]|uniref:Uncharacterized protein n=1 Tax=Dorcoceras hygrometricum TaxID=472368 RepID=A0A2Z7B096_9LAMI|nr:hypothetical protein F511_17503 [Dorcoceras hygrometricum]
MASSLISNTIQVYFDSVLEMDNEGMVAIFEALISFGLSGFLGCLSVIFETALVEFFHNASVRDGVVVSTIQGKPVAISEELFASTFELPLEGLSDLHEGTLDDLSMQIDSDMVIYRTTLLRTFQVVTICRVDKSEVLVVLISPHDSKRLLVQPDEGVSDLVVDRIGDNLPQSTEKSRIIVITVGARHKCQRDFYKGLRLDRFDSVTYRYMLSVLITRTVQYSDPSYSRSYFRCDGYTKTFLAAVHKDSAIFRYQCYNRYKPLNFLNTPSLYPKDINGHTSRIKETNSGLF